MNRIIISIVLAIIIIVCAIANSQEKSEQFRLLNDENSLIQMNNVHIGFLGMGLTYPQGEHVPFWLRSPKPMAPGDYFRHPSGADSMELTSADVNEIDSALTGTIFRRFYDSYILDNLQGYKYSLLSGKVSRREYYVKYGLGDTVYVISGLLGEFLSFYRAVPGDFRLSLDQLKTEAEKLSPVVKFGSDRKFVQKQNENIYFTEYLDRDQKIRVRNYQVIEYAEDEAEAKEYPKGKYYNLIEITKFLDEEALP